MTTNADKTQEVPMVEKHESVLFDEVLENLQLQPGDTVVDGTLGGAGHFRAMLAKLSRAGTIVGIDADEDAIARTERARVETRSEARVVLAHDNFRNLASILDTAGIETIDKALFDLGWSSFHLTAGRGFSFRTNEPLLMTYGSPEGTETAGDLINSSPEETLADIFFTYGEEQFARSIARGIVRARKEAPILTTQALADVVANSTPGWYQHRRLHPATKVFQALRIAVNDELGALREGLSAAMQRLTPGGRIAVITFHSIEDRIVKTMFRDAAHGGAGVLVSKKPIIPGDRETTQNPRARSAKLRVFEASSCARETLEPLTRLYSFL
ncbi:MAG: Ribosomal small subunit methyltransferase [Parcubacteria group bacterium]|nr:Ribosomal small subunit methyltransferase [Parcubacteria group bacterium]